MSSRWLGGYSPLRRLYRNYRPRRASLLTAAGRANSRYAAEFGLQVQRGPFAGLRYPDAARGHAGFLAAKLMGAYERELHPALEEAIARGPAQVVDIGSADGYYLAGLAVRLSGSARLIGYELDLHQRRLCEQVAVLNGLSDAIELRGECLAAGLRDVLAGQALVICDCEGGEFDLLRPDLVPQLRSATLLVELHPDVHPSIGDTLSERFAGSHKVATLPQTRREPGEYPELAGWPARMAYLAISEGWLDDAQWRASTRGWLHLVPVDA